MSLHGIEKQNRKVRECGTFRWTAKKVTRWKNDREGAFELCQSGNEALGLPGITNCSLHENACFPNVAFNRHGFRLTFVKPLLLLRVNVSAFKMACSFHPPSLMEMWKVWVTPFHKESCQGSWLQSDFSSRRPKKKKICLLEAYKRWRSDHNSAQKQKLLDNSLKTLTRL